MCNGTNLFSPKQDNDKIEEQLNELNSEYLKNEIRSEISNN